MSRNISADKTKTEDLAQLCGQVTSMQEAREKLSSPPAIIASIPLLSGRKDSSEPGGKEKEKDKESQA